MDLETINKLYLELSQIATAKTRRELELEVLVVHAGRARQWQPIEGAPKDGTWIIGCRDGEHIARYRATVSKQKFWTDGESNVELTHWLPLPSTTKARDWIF